MNLTPEQWLHTLDREYLSAFIRFGGSAVKFVTFKDDVSPQTLSNDLRELGHRKGYVFVSVNAAHTRIHLVDKLFHEIACNVDWDDLAARFVSKLLEEKGYKIPYASGTMDLAEIAALNKREINEFRKDLASWLETKIYENTDMCKEFKIAMIRLCKSALERRRDEVSRVEHDNILLWLQGKLRRISALKSALIYSKIARYNARIMFSSLAEWISLCGWNGLLLNLDIQRYLISKRPKEKDGTNYYSKTALMDMYEVLRQFVDSTDILRNCLITVMASSRFLSDERRGLNAYTALKMRIFDDVYDVRRPNPLAPLTRLSNQAETYHFNYSKGIRTESQVDAYRALEALRAGVPNRDSVSRLGCHHPVIEKEFADLLTALQENPGGKHKGLLLSAGFGRGKSHLLEYLKHTALENGFVCSSVTISKETPIFDPGKMYFSAMENLFIGDNGYRTINDIVERLDVKSDRFREFENWVMFEDSGLNGRFGASLYLFQNVPFDSELRNKIIRFWAGDRIYISELRKNLKLCGGSSLVKIDSIKKPELARQRFKFLSRLIVAAGFSGWILFIDEAELIGRYSLKQRANAYAELPLLLNYPGGNSLNFGMTSVIAITEDFSSAVIIGKGDLEKIPDRMRNRWKKTDKRLAKLAKKGMEIITNKNLSLRLPEDDDIRKTLDKVRKIYIDAFDWEPPEPSFANKLSSTSMREYIKSWIIEWDHKRMDPEYHVQLETREIDLEYDENADLAPDE